MIKIDLITGILGSGKTTFIRQYAQYLMHNDQRIAILENDFGAVNVDALLLQDLEGEKCQVEMIQGGGDFDCHQRRFKSKLITLAMLGFDRVIMEPSGIFDVDEFFDTLREEPLEQWYEIGNIIMIVDAEMPAQLPEQFEYLLASESACAGKLFINKLTVNHDIDQIIPNILSHIHSSLQKVQCTRQFTSSDILAKPLNDLTAEDFNILFHSGYQAEKYTKLYSIDDILSSTHYFMNISLPKEKIQTVVADILSDSECGQIHRMKGFLKYGNTWSEVNVLNDKITISDCAVGQRVFIVIGENINKEQIDRHFQTFNTDKDYISI